MISEGSSLCLKARAQSICSVALAFLFPSAVEKGGWRLPYFLNNAGTACSSSAELSAATARVPYASCGCRVEILSRELSTMMTKNDWLAWWT
jgi:hypothetical protein